MDPATARFIRDSLGNAVVSSSPVSGGDIGTSHQVELDDGRRCFIKSYGTEPSGMTRAEAQGLAWLDVPGGPRVPKVLAWSDAGPSLLVLEWLESGRPDAASEERFGRALATLHRTDPGGFGLASDNFIGRLPQSNRSHSDWATFYARERIEPQVRMAHDAGHFKKSHASLAEKVVERLPALCGPVEPAARLHGDLWGGNALYDDRGTPCLIDPAVHGGHREVDLAMMRLFGGFGERVFEAYNEAWPLAPGADERVELYQLYPVLVHVNLFGGSYVGTAQRILERFA